jgi:hypothetical protein
MAAKKNNIGRIGSMATAARGNRYVQRLIEDRELRESLRGAYSAARSAYGRMNNGKAPKALFEDRRLQRELAEAANALRDASSALREPPRRARGAKRGRRRVGRSLVLVLAGAALALVLSKDLRGKVLDMLFGSEEEFSYSSTTAPAEPAPATAGSAQPS